MLEALARHESALAPILAARDEAFARASSDPSEDDASRGRIVSEGWRGTKEKRFDMIGVRLPDAADGALDVGASRFSELHVRVSLDGASVSSAARMDRGRVVYANALPHTDRVIASSATRLEELLVLLDARAPRSFSWRMDLPAGISRVVEDAGGLRFEDASGTPKLTMLAPAAYDSNGTHVALQTRWNDLERTFTVTLPEREALTFPVVVDPTYDVTAWFDAALRIPPERGAHALAFDSARGEVVLFGGAQSSSRLNDTWVWRGGTSFWVKRAPATPPPARSHHAMVFDSTRGEMVLFGGVGDAGLLNDTWAWNGATSSWTRRLPASSPPARENAALAFDSARNEVILFAGFGAGGFLADTWAWSGAASSWTERAPTTSPVGRYGHALAFDPTRNEVVLFGGEGAGASLGDTWAWSGATSSWTSRSPVAPPSARGSHALTFDSTRGEIVLFGGSDTSGFLNDTWAWKGAASSWTRRLPAASPPPRAGHGMVFNSARNEIALFGGLGNGGYRRDTWALDGATLSWADRSGSPPPARSDIALAFDSTRGEVVLFGGSGSSGILGDTWVWNGASSWTQRSPSVSPRARYQHALAFDSARGEVVLFGGDSGMGVLDDTWAWNGASSSWTQRLPPLRPPARSAHALAFDSARNEVLMFGGYGGVSSLGDTWVWSGASTTWTPRAPATSPSRRTFPALAFDSARGEVVLFGGDGLAGRMDDTWVWSGLTAMWTQRSPVSPPPARWGHAVAFDSARGEVILFGGFAVAGYTSDTWAWNGASSSWIQRSSSVSPPARIAHALAFDSTRGEIVLFGGGDATGNLRDDVWLYRTLGGSCATDADCLETSFCVDRVCCNARSCGTCATCAGTSPGRCAPVTNEEDADTCALRDGKTCSALGECKGGLGAAASSAAECASGFVVDGVCCSTSTCDACQTCNVALKERSEAVGVCTAARAGTDLHDWCDEQVASSCGRTGMCDGKARCALHPLGTSCGPAGSTCSGAGACVTLSEGSCDGDHTVVAADGTRTDCGLYTCQGAVCRDACTRRTDCVGTADCTADGRCVSFGSQVDPSGEGGCRASATAPPGGWSLVVALGVLARRSGRRRVPGRS